MRIDKRLQELGFFRSRNKASEAILRGEVLVDKRVVLKPSFEVDESSFIEVVGKTYVSRAAFKLNFFLDEIDVEIAGVEAIDIGASSGGFTQVLLERGAKSVTCVDVGKDQLATELKNDSRVLNIEECDIREFEAKSPYGLCVCDLSFIPTSMVLEHIDRLACKDIILLFKPQFEVGKDAKRDKKGVLKDRELANSSAAQFLEQTKSFSWRCECSSVSKLKGKEGNEERFFYFTK
jgi:23S rRNA (cytidine1920-2'-O)/16S rRNA (cytidine1409-2'-O)-methyltransferase